MVFQKFLVEQGTDEINKRVNHRIAVKAVIYKNDKLLLIHTNRGDYKFPGGGVEEKESHHEALTREIAEETGYVHCTVKDKLGKVVERKQDEFDEGAIFQMTSHYYLCELEDEERYPLQLDDYEEEQEFCPIWVSIDEAIEQNDKLKIQLVKNGWIKRENAVLKELKEVYINNVKRRPR
ncbi:NUDIX domain-containing protein [Falsibacillus albus]|uniref:NUDIX domain-containing protein n=1 Tax=Falsibacillus albus TaxID=2478915 RepID=A0A3L7JRT4_9BACI|nr:NUDIX domain-containing protein [Falsibacillus albus]RLQ92421.1 NUDIX domain-containing protein [Falsibacillus albus]